MSDIPGFSTPNDELRIFFSRSHAVFTMEPRSSCPGFQLNFCLIFELSATSDGGSPPRRLDSLTRKSTEVLPQEIYPRQDSLPIFTSSPVSMLPCTQMPYSQLPQYAPSFFKTTLRVLNKITISSHTDQLSTYHASSRTLI